MIGGDTMGEGVAGMVDNSDRFGAGVPVADGATEYRYPQRALAAGYARAGGGLFLTMFPLLVGQPGLAGLVVLGGIAALFAVYGLRVWIRGLCKIRLGDTGVSVQGPRTASIDWDRLATVKLHYYSTRRDKGGGWMQLDISDGKQKLRIESTLAGFPELTRRVVGEATLRGIELSPTTRDNLRPLGIETSDS